ncbi:hypothetical protein HHK36_028129 [Tetracentron sinense]|uniref:Pectinesterase inhibitor domain-containing protein n=1 Tax=Tetracentron sinense TaxID=13715 RepID=A0A834YG13_TETSI|nr:hypothetical protein HHK36_028129 [Tetracentron sinense]
MGYFFYLTLSFLYFLLFINGAIGDPLTIGSTCKAASQSDSKLSYDFCVAALKSDPKSRTADLKGLGIISIELSISNATNVVSNIAKLLKDKSIDPFAKTVLEDCLDLYSDAIPTLKEAVGKFNSKDYYQANVDVSSAMDASSTCEDGFKERKGVVSPLTKENHDIFQLTAISLAIIEMFH